MSLNKANCFQTVQGHFYFLGLVDLEGTKEVLLWVRMNGEEQEGSFLALRVKSSPFPLLLYAWITVSESFMVSLILFSSPVLPA